MLKVQWFSGNQGEEPAFHKSSTKARAHFIAQRAGSAAAILPTLVKQDSDTDLLMF